MKSALQTALLLIAAMAFAGCEQDGPAEELGQDIDEAAEEVRQAVDDACEDIKEGAGAENTNC